jgi:glycosyltransferase involved in cell wall biosynthesis
MLNVVFAPDWRPGNPYQELLANALRRHGVYVSVLNGYKRIFPLWRLVATRQCHVLHLHWPEVYYTHNRSGLNWLRYAGFPLDLAGATKRCVLATTAHDLEPHKLEHRRAAFLKSNVRHVHLEADVVFAHSNIAKQHLVDSFQLAAEKVRVIPHGDLSVFLGTPFPASMARRELGLGAGKLAVVFGTIEPYKGLEEIIDWWQHANPDIKLAVIGRPSKLDYAGHVLRKIGNATNIAHRFEWIPDELLRLWLSAADVAIFNYRKIFTSGAANLARCFGLPVLLPKRLDNIVLDEPTPYVRRFASFATDFGEQLLAALTVRPDFAAASFWRESCSWNRVARLTAEGYRYAISSRLWGCQQCGQRDCPSDNLHRLG